MPKGLIFFCCACCILLLTIINLSIGPIISGKVSYDSGYDWGTVNIAKFEDEYDQAKKDGDYDDVPGNVKKYGPEWYINMWKRKKAMHDMEYTAFVFDIVIGFVCGLIGLLHLFEIKKDYVEKTGLIGLCCGGVGFVLTFVYLIFNGLVYTSYYDFEHPYIKRNGDGAFAKLDGEKYKLIYFDKTHNTHALIAKYSDLIKKQYNYNKGLKDSFEKDEVKGCIENFPDMNNGNVDESGHFGAKRQNSYTNKDCQYLYYTDSISTITNKDISDRFLTTLILSLFVCLANIGLGIFGFLMAKSGEF